MHFPLRWQSGNFAAGVSLVSYFHSLLKPYKVMVLLYDFPNFCKKCIGWSHCFSCFSSLSAAAVLTRFSREDGGGIC